MHEFMDRLKIKYVRQLIASEGIKSNHDENGDPLAKNSTRHKHKLTVNNK